MDNDYSVLVALKLDEKRDRIVSLTLAKINTNVLQTTRMLDI